MTSAAEAQELLQQGRLADAEQAFAALLKTEPDNIQALNFMALTALRNRDMRGAEELIQRALATAGDDPLTLHNHGRILEAAGNHVAAAAAQRAALAVAPHYHAARLLLGRALELSGQKHASIVAYARALQDAQRDGRWLDKATTPPALQPRVEDAVFKVRHGRLEAIERLLQPVIAVYGNEPLRRIEKSLRIFFNAEERVPADPRQNSKFYHYPDIPAHPYLDLKLFPWVEAFEARTSEIQRELLSLLPDTRGRERVFASEALEADHLRGLKQPPSWNGYYFYRYGERRDENCERCPQTAAALDSVPLCRVRKHGPEVLFSVFTPGTHLLAHRGVTNTRVVAHLPLMVPEDCALRVGGEEHRWQEGKVVVFDDTFEHEAWNRSDRTRVVLIFDLWSPYLTAAERAALEVLIYDIGEFNVAVDAAA
jgi:aspartate beta-hydroxylase